MLRDSTPYFVYHRAAQRYEELSNASLGQTTRNSRLSLPLKGVQGFYAVAPHLCIKFTCQVVAIGRSCATVYKSFYRA